MLATVWTEPELLRHHPDMLVVMVRRSAAPIARALAGRPDAVRERAPGLHALHQLETEGQLHYVVPLDPKARRRVARQQRSGHAAAAIHAAAREHKPGRRHTGHVLVHLRDAALRPKLARRLAADPHVAAVSKVSARYLWVGAGSSGSQPGGGMLPPERLWNHARIQLGAARKLKRYRVPREIKVAVLDSGVQTTHPALRGRVHDYVHRYELGHPVSVSPRDIVGHGTHISGIINAAGDRRMGVEGICHCRLTVMKVFGDQLVADSAAKARVFLVNPVLYRWALAECLARRFDIINLSLGGPAPPDPQEAALLQGLMKGGTTIVAAMGNAFKQRSLPAYPAATPGVIAVGAVGPDDVVAPFSRRGPHITLVAPGVAIWSTLPTFPGEFGYFSTSIAGDRRARLRPLARNTRFDAWPGTSGACPHVTAAVALLLASRGMLTPAQVKARLMSSADRVPGMRGKRFDPGYGAGRLNIRKLLESRP